MRGKNVFRIFKKFFVSSFLVYREECLFVCIVFLVSDLGMRADVLGERERLLH